VHLVYDKDEDQIDLDLDMGNSSFQHIPQENSQQPSRQPAYPPQQAPENNFGYPQQAQYYQPPAAPPVGQYAQNKRRPHPPKSE
jgi:hypothetical protein